PLQGRIDLGLGGAGQDLRAHLGIALTGAGGAQGFSKVWMYTRASVRAFTWTAGPGERFRDARTRTILVACQTLTPFSPNGPPGARGRAAPCLGPPCSYGHWIWSGSVPRCSGSWAPRARAARAPSRRPRWRQPGCVPAWGRARAFGATASGSVWTAWP